MTGPLVTLPDAPLRGVRVLSTRAQRDGGILRSRLEEMGAEVLELPALEIAPPEDFAPLDAALRRLPGYDWVAFTSRNAVRAVFDRLSFLGLPGSLPESLRVAAVGSSTASDLQMHGVIPDCLPDEATSKALAAAMAGLGVRDAHILLPVGNLAGSELRQGLERVGAQVDQVIAYRTIRPAHIDAVARERLRRGTIDVVAIASPSAIRNLVEMLGSERQLLHDLQLACIGPTTAAAVRELGLQPTVVASEHTLDGLVAAIAQLSTREKSVGRN
jgi:uroporphyrinogen III methyltransferase/synthase